MAKSIDIDVKSKGKVLGTVTVDEYVNVPEALKALGDESVLGLINRQNKADITNEFRQNLTKVQSSASLLKQIAKKDPKKAKEIEELILKVSGISTSKVEPETEAKK